jgi:hypothetical protein
MSRSNITVTLQATILCDVTPCTLPDKTTSHLKSIQLGRKLLFSVIRRRVVRSKSTDVSEEYVASTFSVRTRGQARNQHEAGWSFLAYFFTLKMEAICSSETSVDSLWTTRRYTPLSEPQLQQLTDFVVTLLS